jgi:hypothetical protein
MSALLKSHTEQALHYWMLWVAPNATQTQAIKRLPANQQSRVLMLHPKNMGHITKAVEVAILSNLYQMITLPKALLNTCQQHHLEQLAIQNNTIISWVDNSKQLNSASQLTLI